MFANPSRVSSLKLASVGAIAAVALAAAPTSLAAARVSTADARTTPYSTVSVTPGAITSGATVTVTGNGPRNAHAGVWITLQADAFASKTSVDGIPLGRPGRARPVAPWPSTPASDGEVGMRVARSVRRRAQTGARSRRAGDVPVPGVHAYLRGDQEGAVQA